MFFFPVKPSRFVLFPCPHNGLLSLLNSLKSHGAKSSVYSGCGTTCADIRQKRSNAVRYGDGALVPIDTWGV